MSKPFDMELFLAGVLTGSHATRQHHIRQAKIIQAAIADRWQRDTPWAWQRKKFGMVSRISNASTQRHYAILLLADCPAACSTFRNVMDFQSLKQRISQERKTR
jgi:hypothetical protein